MESRRLITAVTLALLLWIVLQQIHNKINPPKPQAAPAPVATVATQAAATLPTQTSTAAAVNGSIELKQDKARNDNITLGSNVEKSKYKMQLTLSNIGASVSTVELTEHAQTPKSEKRYRLLTLDENESQILPNSLATRRIILSDESGMKIAVELDKAKWFHRIDRTENEQTLTFELEVNHENKPLVKVVKTYRLQKDNSDLAFNLTVENVSGRNLTAVIEQAGFVGVQQEDIKVEDRKVWAGTRREGRESITVTSQLRTELLKNKEYEQRIGAVDEQVVWSGQTNKYFAALMAVVDEKGKLDGSKIDYVDAKIYTDKADLGEDLSTIWVSKPLALAGEKKVSLNYDVYLGPKSEQILYYGKYVDRNYGMTFDHSWCTMQWLADFMAWLLNKFYLVTRNYGVAIILLVIVVRVVLHPVSKSSQVSMIRMQRQMQRLQPKINALKAQYKNNREGYNKATMELYKQEGVNPAGQIMGCLPMMLQLPIWAALWSALNNTFELRHQPFVLWIKDLAGPDALIHFSTAFNIPLISGMMGPIHELNILPLIVMASMILQQVFSPQAAPNPDADPAQVKQQKFMFYFMSLFMGLIFYNAPSGLNLYILTSNLLGLVESKRIREHLEAEQKLPPKEKKAGPNIIERFQKKMEKMAKDYEKEKERKAK